MTNFNYKEKKKRKLLISPCSILCILYSTRCCTIIKIYIFLSSQDTKIISLVLNIWIWYWIYIHTCNPTYNYLPKYWWFIPPCDMKWKWWFEFAITTVCTFICGEQINIYIFLNFVWLEWIFSQIYFTLYKPCPFL